MTAIDGVIAKFSSLVDGTLRLVVDVDLRTEEKRVEVMTLFCSVGAQVAIARLTDKPNYGDSAKQLRQSGFFRVPEVWRAVGTDEDFLAFVRGLPCSVRGSCLCAGDIVAAHVRRVHLGSGTGIKPAYAAIPLCDQHHRLAHQHGDTHIMPEEQWLKRRIETVEQWAWEQFKSNLGKESFKDIPPEDVRLWAEKRELTKYLPTGYGG